MTILDVANILFPASAPDSIAEATQSGNVTGNPVDMGKTAGNCLAVLASAAIVGTPSFAIQVKECDTIGGSYANVANGGVATLAAANDRQVLTFKNTKRFVKAVATLTGTTSLVFGVSIFKVG